MNRTKNIYITLFLILLSTFILLSFSSKNTMTEQANNPEDGYNIYAIDIPEMLNFSGESMPIHIPDVRERIDRELLVNTYWQSNGLLMFKRAQRYFPIIEPILKSYAIPDDFKYLALIESGLQNVTSSAGAKGFWQIMKSTGKEYGLEINSNVDERNNLELATYVACKYLLKAKSELGSWTLAAASYNAGINGVKKKLKRQEVSDYYDLLFGEETGRYVFRIVALKEILTHPKKYGFNFSKKHLYETVPTYKIKVDTAVADFTSFARKFDLNYKQLKIHNPWLRESFLNNRSNKIYYLEIPNKGYYND